MKKSQSTTLKDTVPLRDPESRKLHIIPIGDLFRERYYVPTTSDDESPVSYPEAMRGKAAVRSTTIPSGTQLHADVLTALVAQLREQLQEHVPDNCLPVVVHPGKLNDKSGEWQHFNTYLHELGPFPAREATSGNTDKVWRVSHTQGLVEDDEGSSDVTLRRKRADKILDAQLKRATKAIDNVGDRSSIMLVVNDRNHGFRERHGEVRGLLTSLEKKCCTDTSNNTPPEDLLILWHIRKPRDSRKTRSCL